MAKTAPNRRKRILEEWPSVSAVIEKFSPLQESDVVGMHVQKVTGKHGQQKLLKKAKLKINVQNNLFPKLSTTIDRLITKSPDELVKFKYIQVLAYVQLCVISIGITCVRVLLGPDTSTGVLQNLAIN